MKPYYRDPRGVVIYHANSSEILEKMKDGSISLIVTDPPYNAINRKTGGLRMIDKGSADTLPVDVKRTASEMIRVVSGSVYIWCSDEQYTDWSNALRDGGLTTRKCAWWKTNPSPMNGQYLWLSSLELCVFDRKPKAAFNLRCAHPVWKGPVDKASAHPTPKPVWLIEQLVKASSQPGDIVLDPYMGGGSTLVSCILNGRRGIGVEIDERYCEIAAKRLQSTL